MTKVSVCVRENKAKGVRETGTKKEKSGRE